MASHQKNPLQLEPIEEKALHRMRPDAPKDLRPHGPDRYPSCLIRDGMAHDVVASFLRASTNRFRPKITSELVERLRGLRGLQARLHLPKERLAAIYVAAFERLAFASMLNWGEELEGVRFRTEAEQTHLWRGAIRRRGLSV